VYFILKSLQPGTQCFLQYFVWGQERPAKNLLKQSLNPSTRDPAEVGRLNKTMKQYLMKTKEIVNTPLMYYRSAMVSVIAIT